MISDWHAECVDFSVFPVMENAQRRSPTKVRRHTDTTDYNTELHKALLWGYTKELRFRTRCNQTQEVGTVIIQTGMFLRRRKLRLIFQK